MVFEYKPLVEMETNDFNQPTEAELEILQVLWAHEPTTVRVVHEQICQTRELGYTTVLKQMQRMTEKGMVRAKRKGKSNVYTTVLKETEVQRSLFDRLLSTAFKGSAMDLVMHALGHKKASEAEIEQLKRWLDTRHADSPSKEDAS